MLPILILPLLSIPAALAGEKPSSPQTITDLEPYASLLPCARNCFGTYSDCCSCDKVAQALGCDFNCQGTVRGAPNSCYCRGDRISSANAYLSSCVKANCGGVGDYRIDLASVSTLYNGYCSSLGYFAAEAGEGSTAVSEGGRSRVVSSGTLTSSADGTSRSDDRTRKTGSGDDGGDGGNVENGGSGPAPSDLSDGSKAAIALGVMLGFALAVILGFVIWWVKARRRSIGNGNGNPVLWQLNAPGSGPMHQQQQQQPPVQETGILPRLAITDGRTPTSLELAYQRQGGRVLSAETYPRSRR